LFEGIHPTRIFLGIVESEKAAGTQNSSPFEFYRKWNCVVPDDGICSDQIESDKEKTIKFLQQQLAELKMRAARMGAGDSSNAAQDDLISAETVSLTKTVTVYLTNFKLQVNGSDTGILAR